MAVSLSQSFVLSLGVFVNTRVYFLKFGDTKVGYQYLIEALQVSLKIVLLKQLSPTFLAPGTVLWKTIFPRTDRGQGMVQAVMRVMGNGR